MDKVTRKLDGASADAKKKAIHKMLEALINEDGEEANDALHDYLQSKMRQMILGEECDDEEEEKKDEDKDDDKDDDDDDDKKEKVDEMDRSKQFANSGKVMDDKVKGDVKFDNGGKKTLKKHGNAPKELDDDHVEKVKFKNGGKQPAKTLEKTPKPEHFDDGRDRELGTTK
jgi:hypothetical protein